MTSQQKKTHHLLDAPKESNEVVLRLPDETEYNDEMKAKIERLMTVLDRYGIDYDKFDPTKMPRLDFGDRKAYPNVEVYNHIPGQRDTQKWLQAVREIYNKEHNGESRVNAIRRITSGWDLMETHDFLNWVRFYEAGDHMKYKFAQLWYENPQMGPGYFLQVKKDPEPPSTQVADQDVNDARDEANLDSERRHIIEKQRNKIIGRLDSAEKLLRSPDGQIFSGKEFESLLESIYQLKKKIQMVNKISSSTRLYEDMIIREANVLRRNGFSEAAEMLYVVAQSPGQSGEQATGDKNAPPNLPPPASPGDPSGAGNPGPPSGGIGNTGGTPAQPDGNATFPQSAPSGQPQEPVKDQPKGISDFIAGLEDGGFSPSDEQIVDDDELEVRDTDDIIVTEAQAMPPAPIDEPLTSTPPPAPLDPSPVSAPDAPIKPSKPSKPSKPKDESLEVTEDDIGAPPDQVDVGPAPDAGLNNKIDSMFANVTIADIVSELEDLSKIFKVREIPRRISKVDMMLDGKGLASYFPSLSEAQNKALEANNYISTRVEDILSKLRGAITTKEIDLKGGDEVESPEVAGIKGKLKSDEDKEKARKQMRKDQEEAELAGNKETPDVEIEEDLGAPPAPKAPVPKIPPAKTAPLV